MKTLLLVSCDFTITRRNYIIMKTVSLHLTYTNQNKLKESDVKEVSFLPLVYAREQVSDVNVEIY